MKNIFYLSILLVFISSCTSITEKEAKEFVISHFNEKVGGELAVEPFKADIGDSLIFHNLATGWSGRPDWVLDNSLVTADWFYEEVQNMATLMSGGVYVLFKAMGSQQICKLYGLRCSWNINVDVKIASHYHRGGFQ